MKSSLLDSPVPDNQAPILQPTALHATGKSTKNTGWLLDAPVPDIKAPVLKPKKTNNFFIAWVHNKVLEPIKKPINAAWSKILKLRNKYKYSIHESNTAIEGFTKQYTIKERPGTDAKTFLSAVQPIVVGLLEKHRQIKINLILTCVMKRIEMTTGEVFTTNAPFRSTTQVNLEVTDAVELYSKAVSKMVESMASFLMMGSGWKFQSVLQLDINTVEYRPLRGNTYIPLPGELAAKKAIINMKNMDDECFKWCLTRSLNPVEKNSERISKELRKQAEHLNWNGITFSVTLKEIREEQ